MKTTITILILAFVSLVKAQQTTWIEVPVPTTKNLTCIAFPSPLVGYIGGEDSLLLKTTDGGNTWQHVPYSGINFYPGGENFVDIDFVTEEIGFAAVGPYSGTYRTDDGGLTWTLLNTSGSLCFNAAIYFFADNEGFVGGSGCFQGELMDHFTGQGNGTAVNLDGSSFSTSDMIVDIDFDLDQFASVGLAVSSGGRILRTTDSGNNWDSIPSPLGNSVPLTTVTIVNSNLAYIGYDNGPSGLALLISTDGGLTWSVDGNSGTFAYPIFHDLHTTSSNRVYCGTTSTSMNTGYIMELLDPSAVSPFWSGVVVDEPIYAMTSHSDTIVWGAGKNGYVVTRGPSNLSIDTHNSAFAITVFPNPADDFIQLNIPSELGIDTYHLEIYSIDGKLMAKGEPNVNQMSITNLNKGTYMIHLVGSKQVQMAKFVKQ